MTEKQLREIFKAPYNFNQWKSILEFIFGKVDYFSSPNNPFEETKKVILGKQYGHIPLKDGKFIALFEVQVDDSVNIERNRQGLREIAAKYIDQNITHGALVFYHSPKQEDYRFTFVAKWTELDEETGELIKGETPKKRYTYLLGKNQSGTTAAKRILELAEKKNSSTINDIIQAFSVEALNKEFFRKYKEHYEKFWRYIDGHSKYQEILIDKSPEKSEEEKRKPIRDFAKKLLGRIVFLHFLQKKGWLGCSSDTDHWEDGDPHFLKHLFDHFSKKSQFYSQCLTKLFFDTLNNPNRPNHIFEVTGTRVPYLNGGLFDSDLIETFKIDFPESYFKELLEFFEQYNFTIDENSPDEQEVGIDPEMLGHIFENLLEENRERGAFYTPKEIVSYMCQESLIQYLNNYLPREAQVEAFIHQQFISDYLKDKANAEKLDNLLGKVKVCDPAIGSGAFPIGILQEIFKAKLHIYPYLKSIQPFDPAETKKRIIEESIYGVDVEPGAVDIARLRFWLALVVDEDYPQPLPNLDYKIMQGNSLLECFEGIDLSKVANTKNDVNVFEPARDLFGNIIDHQMNITFSQRETIKQIQILIKKYFNEKNPKDKNQLKSQINELVHQHIDYNLELRENQLSSLISEIKHPDQLNKSARTKYEEWKIELEGFKRKREKLYRIQNTEEKPYFIWHLFFKEVFDQGGFDIVIGNPPYIQLQKLKNESIVLEEANFETFARTGDIYCLFYEKGNQILKPEGSLIYITSNKWMSSAYGKNLRKYLIEKTNPKILIDFSEAVIFPSAVVFVNILSFKKEAYDGGIWTVKAKEDYTVGKSILYTYVREKGVRISELKEENWTVVEKEDYIIKKQIETIGTPLKEWHVQFFAGIKSGFNDAYHIELDKKKELSIDNKSQQVIKPLLRGKDIKRYVYSYEDKYILFIPWHFPLHEDESISNASLKAEEAFKTQYPSIYKHLEGYKNELAARNSTETGIRYEWYALQRYGANFWKEFEKEKIIWIEISDRANYCLDTKAHYLTNSAYFLTGENLKYLVVLLNSKILDFYHFQNTAQIAGGRKRYTKQYVELLPIPQISKVKMQPFEIMADYLSFLNDPTAPNIIQSQENFLLIEDFEATLNIMVYELYFEQHMKELELDVLNFFNFPDISYIHELNEKKLTIQKVWYQLQEKDNPIRNRIILSNIKSPILSKINAAIY